MLRMANVFFCSMPYSLFFAKTLIEISATTFRHQDVIFSLCIELLSIQYVRKNDVQCKKELFIYIVRIICTFDSIA